MENKEKSEKDPNSILVCTWHPKLKQLQSILNENFKILDSDPKLRTIFKERHTVAFRRKKNLENFLCKNDIKQKEKKNDVQICKGCQLCRVLSETKTVINEKTGSSITIKSEGNCKSTGVIYAVKCKKCELIYIGHTGDSMSERYAKHKYDIKKRPENNDLANHCHKGHDIEKDLEIFIIEHGNQKLEERKRREDKYICKLQTLVGTGMNTDIGAYAKEMYYCWTSTLQTSIQRK